MNTILMIIYLIIALIGSEIAIMIATHQSEGIYTIYMSNSTLYCMLFNLLFLIAGIWSFGFMYGLLVWILHFFSIFHITIGWFLAFVFSLIVGSEQRIVEIENTLIRLVDLTMFVVVILLFVQFKYKYLLAFTGWNIMKFVILSLIIGFILRGILEKMSS